MTLKAKRHWATPDVIVVTDEDIEWKDGNVVARYNSKYDILGRTPRAKGISTKAIRSAIASLSS